MRWPAAIRAEVLGRDNQPDSEQVLPESVDGNASGERMGRIDEPAGQVESIGRGAAGLQRRQKRGRGRRDFRAWPQEVPTGVDVRFRVPSRRVGTLDLPSGSFTSRLSVRLKKA